MGKYNSFARRADELARGAFSEYSRAADALRDAERAVRDNPQPHGLASAELTARAARAQADLLDARSAFSRAKADLEGKARDLNAIQKELAEAVERDYAADPAAIDAGTLELLKSGILTPGEYARLMGKAQSEGNTTMARIIAKYANDAADTAAKEYGQGDHKAAELRSVVHQGLAADGSDVLDAFSLYTNVFNRILRNDALIPYWDELTGHITANL